MASTQPQMYGQPSSDPAAELQRQMATAAAQQAAQQGAQAASQKAKHGFYEIKAGEDGKQWEFLEDFLGNPRNQERKLSRIQSLMGKKGNLAPETRDLGQRTYRISGII